MNRNETERIVKPDSLLVNEIPMDERVSQLLETYRVYAENCQWLWEQQRKMKEAVISLSLFAIEDATVGEGYLLLRRETWTLIEPIYDDAQVRPLEA